MKEWSSLKAFLLVAKIWKRTWQKRADIMHRRRATDEYINAWFAGADRQREDI
jgi:hypothetical protein